MYFLVIKVTNAADAAVQDLKPFDQALQVAMAIIIHLELFVAVRAVSIAPALASRDKACQKHTADCSSHWKDSTLSNSYSEPCCWRVATFLAHGFE